MMRRGALVRSNPTAWQASIGTKMIDRRRALALIGCTGGS